MREQRERAEESKEKQLGPKVASAGAKRRWVRQPTVNECHYVVVVMEVDLVNLTQSIVAEFGYKS